MRRTTVAVTAGALLLLTGCASVSSGTIERGDARSAVLTAAVTTQQAGTARISVDVRTLGSDPAALALDGRLALDGSKADLTASLPAGTLGGSKASVHEIVVDGSAYLQVQGIDMLPAVWVKADLGKDGAGSGDNPLSHLATTGGVDDLLAALREVGTVEKVARQEVGGVQTTKYHATLDAPRSSRTSPPSAASTSAASPRPRRPRSTCGSTTRAGWCGSRPPSAAAPTARSSPWAWPTSGRRST